MSETLQDTASKKGSSTAAADGTGFKSPGKSTLGKGG